MPLQPCPITGAFLKQVGLQMKETPALYHDLEDCYEELQSLQRENYPTEGALHLRGLYTIEILYHQFLPSFSQSVEMGLDLHDMRAKRFDRSVSGMKKLIAYLDVLVEDSEVMSYARELAGKTDEQVQTWMQGCTTNWVAVLTSLIYSASYMETALRGNVVKFERFGLNLGVCCVRVTHPVENSLAAARTLLSINNKNGPHPWNLQTSSPG